MTRLEKIKLAIEKGFTYDEVTGKIYGVRGKEIKSKINGYIRLYIRNGKKELYLYGHQFAFYYKYKKIVEQIDHINGTKDDNRICNLREVTPQENQHNRTTAKGYYHNGYSYCSQIVLNKKLIYLGSFHTEEEARQVYLEAKKIHHII